MDDEKFGSIKLLKFKYKRGDQIIQIFCKIGFPQKLGLPLLFNKFQNSEESTCESCRMHWNLMNDEKYGSRKLSKLKYRRGEQIYQTFCKIGSQQKLCPASLICRNFKILWEKCSWINENALKSSEWRRICNKKTFKIEIRKGEPYN